MRFQLSMLASVLVCWAWYADAAAASLKPRGFGHRDFDACRRPTEASVFSPSRKHDIRAVITNGRVLIARAEFLPEISRGDQRRSRALG